MGRKVITITPEKVQEIKKILPRYGLRETARITGVSFTTARNVYLKKYDSDQPLQAHKDKFELFTCCPITGLKSSY